MLAPSVILLLAVVFGLGLEPKMFFSVSTAVFHLPAEGTHGAECSLDLQVWDFDFRVLMHELQLPRHHKRMRAEVVCPRHIYRRMHGCMNLG